eukprot:g16149.t1
MSARRRLFKGVSAVGGAALGVGYVQRLPKTEDHQMAWSQSMSTRLYTDFALPVVLQTDPETAHNLTLKCGEALQAFRSLWPSLPMECWEGRHEGARGDCGGTAPEGPPPFCLSLFRHEEWLLSPPEGRLQGPELSQQVWGLTFESPVGIAAGFDKNALLDARQITVRWFKPDGYWRLEIVPLYRAGLFGLGFAEIGSVSAKPAAGNARPRCWRIPSDDVVVNAMGLNNEGSDALAQRLREMEATSSGQGQRPVGVNIAKTHDPSILGPAAVEDFVQSFRTLSPLADFVVLNVSCPNTTEGKTFEERSKCLPPPEPDALAGLLSAVAKEVRGRAKPPILVKLMATPDSEE